MSKKEIFKRHKENGVVFFNSDSVDIDSVSIIEENVEIGFGVKICESVIKKGTKIGNNTTIINSKIGENNDISQSQIESSSVGQNNKIGPFSHIRPNTFIGNNCRIGNFVELKNSHISDGTKIAHLAYVGDATIGKNVNVGCGVIFANYDGKKKHHTEIGDNVFIGSNCNLVAPLKIGAGVLIGAGTTVTKDVPANKLCIGRVRQEVKEFKSSSNVKKLFGTDGIRGEFGTDITTKLAYDCANALSSIKKSAKIIIGRDTRKSGKCLVKTFCKGAKDGGATIFDVGILPTPALSYLTIKNKFDFGVVISASHNSEEYNGIKIFAYDGKKISNETESQIENAIGKHFSFLGGKIKKMNMEKEYVDFLVSNLQIENKKFNILLDCANGATEKIGNKVFSELKIKAKQTKNKFKGINNQCGSTHIENLTNNFKVNDNIAFSFDGDGDRIHCLYGNKSLFDGDKILLALALFELKQDSLKNHIVVGTIHTNMAIEEKLKEVGIILERANVGDKYVMEKMIETGASLGAEQSGHVIQNKYLCSGDGLLTALKLCEIYVKNPEILDEVEKLELFPQININVKVKNKEKVANNEILLKLKKEKENQFQSEGRILIRASGTEPKVRIMIEHKKNTVCEETAKEFEKLLKIISE